MTNELTLPERAAVALGTAKHEVELVLLVAEASTIESVKNKDGREQCHSMAMTLKGARVAIEKAGKAAREDAQAFSKAVIAEQARLIAIIEPDETRLIALRDEWDAERERERQAKIDAERNRVGNIRNRLDGMAGLPLKAIGQSSSFIDGMMGPLRELNTVEGFAEFYQEAEQIKTAVLSQLQSAKDAAITAEREAVRLAAEQEELRKMREEIEARRLEQERLAAEERARHDADMQAQRDALEVERRRMAEESARMQAVADDLARSKAEADMQKWANKEANEQRQEEAATPDAPILDLFDAPVSDRPSEAEIVNVLTVHYEVDEITVRGWLAEIVIAGLHDEIKKGNA